MEMNTKNKGDILAARIEEILRVSRLTRISPELREALAEYRVKPEPVIVPLGPEDVKCGDRLKQSHFKPGVEFQILAVLKDGIGKFVHENDEFRVDLILWSELKSDWLISRDGGKTWAKCEKPEGGK